MENKLKKLELKKPSLEYKDSFVEAVKEFEAKGENIYLHVQEPTEDFDSLLIRIKERESRKDLPENKVPQTELWLISGGEFVGWIKIRHKLNEKLLIQGGHIGYAIRPSRRKMGFGDTILKLALPISKALGVDKALLTCDDDNIGSIKIIENNGGILENKITYEGKLKRRYWI